MSTIVTHYESLQEGAFNGTPLWGIFLASVQWVINHLLCKVASIWFFFFSFLRCLRARWLRIMRSIKEVPLTAPPFGHLFGFGSAANQALVLQGSGNLVFSLSFLK
jgi:hypothetical protein